MDNYDIRIALQSILTQLTEKNRFMRLKRLLSLGIAIMLLPLSSFATHIFGGQIYWKRISTNQFQFYMELYGDIGTGVAGMPTSVNLTNNAGVTLNLQNLSTTTYPGACSNSYTIGKKVYRSSIVTLNTPPAAGWTFTYSNCCKSNAVTNLTNPGSQSIEVSATMLPAALSVYANGEYCEPPRIIGVGDMELVTNSAYTIPLIAEQNYSDSIHTEFEALMVGATPLTYNAGYSGTQPLPGIAQGAWFDPVIANNIMTLHPNAIGAYSVGIRSETYFNGQLASVQHIDVLSVVNTPTSSFNKAPDIWLNASSHPTTTLPVNPLTGDSSAVEVNALLSDTLTFNVTVTDTIGDPTPLTASINSSSPGIVSIVSTPALGYMVTVVPSLDPSISSMAGGQLDLMLLSEDGGCPRAGTGTQRILINILPAALSNASICMVAADTAALKHYVYIDAPENNNGSSITLISFEYDNATGNWSSDTANLPDNDTIYEHSISSSLPTVAYFVSYTDAATGMITGNDDVQVGNLPLSVTSAGTINQISLPYASSKSPLWIKLFRKPFGAPNSSYSEVDSVFNPSIVGGLITLMDTVTTAASYDYTVEAMVDYACDTTQMNLKNWWYYTTLTSAQPATTNISIKEISAVPFAVYPNPTSGMIFLDSDEIEALTVWSLSGQKLMEVQSNNQIDISHLSNGMYLLEIKNINGQRYSTRILKK
ncbi:MAG: hypothetical protein SchgKO_24010 [Schleiferiaceae bacterium]